MKKYKPTRLLIFFFCMLFCGSIFAQKKTPFSEIGSIPDGKGIVYIYRPYQFAGSAVHYHILANDQRVSEVKLKNKTYLTYLATPGKNIFSWDNWRDGENGDFLLVVEAGKSYFLKFSLDGLERVSNNEALPEISKCSLIENTPGN